MIEEKNCSGERKGFVQKKKERGAFKRLWFQVSHINLFQKHSFLEKFKKFVFINKYTQIRYSFNSY